MRMLATIEQRDLICAEPIAQYQEMCGDLKAAVGVRDRDSPRRPRRGRCTALARPTLNAAGSSLKRANSREPTWPRVPVRQQAPRSRVVLGENRPR